NHFPGTIHPRGERYLKKFELDDCATWHYQVNRARIIKRVLVCWQQNATAVRYEIDPHGHAMHLRLLPFVSLRDFHATLRKGPLDETERGEVIPINRGESAVSL